MPEFGLLDLFADLEKRHVKPSRHCDKVGL
jgi:hypothetical protein